MTLTTTPTDTTDIIRADPNPFATPPITTTTFTFPRSTTEYQHLTQNFVNAINHPGTPLIAPATDASHAIELANAITMAGLTRTPVQLPFDPDIYENFLADLRTPR